MKQAIIESLDIFGQGIARDEGKCVFVRGALPGEQISYQIDEEKSKYDRGHAVNILRHSLQRLEPVCAHFGRCGGCRFQHIDYAGECAAKEAHVRRCLSLAGVANERMRALEPAPAVLHYRNKASFHGENGKIGFYGENSHDFIGVGCCHLLKDALNRVAACLSVTGCAEAETVVLRANGFGQVVMRVKGALSNSGELAARLMSLSDDLIGVVCDDAIYGESSLKIDFGHLSLSFSPDSFCQINRLAATDLLNYAREIVTPGGTALDLYCGVGTVSLFLADRFDEIYGLDVVPDAIRDAEANARANAVPAHFFAGKAEEKLSEMLARAPRAQTVIVDPPRQGLARSVARTLNDYGADQFLYISCDAATLSRDLKLLSNYRVTVAKPFDLFPRTAHVETVVLMSRVKE